jgi:hypothetical protein
MKFCGSYPTKEKRTIMRKKLKPALLTLFILYVLLMLYGIYHLLTSPPIDIIDFGGLH